MSSLKDELIRLGEKHDDLRSDLRPVIDSLGEGKRMREASVSPDEVQTWAEREAAVAVESMIDRHLDGLDRGGLEVEVGKNRWDARTFRQKRMTVQFSAPFDPSSYVETDRERLWLKGSITLKKKKEGHRAELNMQIFSEKSDAIPLASGHKRSSVSNRDDDRLPDLSGLSDQFEEHLDGLVDRLQKKLDEDYTDPVREDMKDRSKRGPHGRGPAASVQKTATIDCLDAAARRFNGSREEFIGRAEDAWNKYG